MKGYAYKKLHVCDWMEKSDPTPGQYDAVIKPLIVSVCTSDIHHIEFGTCAPNKFLGHEGIGEIVKVGKEVKDFKAGDKVIIPATTPDWRTIEAQMGHPEHGNGFCMGCLLGSIDDGLFAEYTLIRDADMNLALIPDGMDLFAAAMIGDMVTTGFSGAEMAEVGFGDTVVVLGIGPVGLMAIAGSRLKGAARIIGIGSRPKCVEVAKHYGANDILNYKNEDIVQGVLKMTKGKGADRVIIASGGSTMLDQAFRMLRIGGIIANLNTFTANPKLDISSEGWGYGLAQKTLRSGLCPGGRARMEYLAAMVQYNRIDPTALITHKFNGIEHLPDAVKLMINKPDDLIKPVVIY